MHEGEKDKQQLDFFVRQNRRRQLLPHVRESLSKALGLPVAESDFLALPDTDVAANEFKTAYQAARGEALPSIHAIFPERDRWQIQEILKPLRRLDVEAILFAKGFEHCGALRTRLWLICMGLFELLETDESVAVLAADRSQGFLLDRFEAGSGDPPPADEWRLELYLWGSEWLRASEHGA